jgi:hypothetical protein
MKVLIAFALGTLVACGGGTDSITYQQAVADANQMEAQARSLGVDLHVKRPLSAAC